MKAVKKREELLKTARELSFFDDIEARSYQADIMNNIDAETVSDTFTREWFKIVWYGDECGGKLIKFKYGNPYLKKCKRLLALPNDENETDKEAKRLSASLSRTKRRIFEIAACNPWNWFFTGTLDGEKCDRNDLNGTFKRLAQFLRDYRKKQTGERITYLIVPEQHKDGAWHFHGLISGLSETELHCFGLSEQLPERIRKTIESGVNVHTWKEYERRFGWATFTAVRSQKAVSMYVTKYITKDMVASNVGTNRHLYYASQGLKKPEVVAEGHTNFNNCQTLDYENDYIGVRDIPDCEELNATVARYFGW